MLRFSEFCPEGAPKGQRLVSPGQRPRCCTQVSGESGRTAKRFNNKAQGKRSAALGAGLRKQLNPTGVPQHCATLSGLGAGAEPEPRVALCGSAAPLNPMKGCLPCRRRLSSGGEYSSFLGRQP